MSTDQSRAVALAFVENFSAGRVQAALDLLAEDAVWWVAGHPGQFPVAGTYRKADLPKLFQWIGSALPQGVQVSMQGVTAEQERVAIEVEARGTTAQGKDYFNQVHFLFEVRSGKITRVREYLDTQHAFDRLIEPA